jgi:hypothetical protein
MGRQEKRSRMRLLPPKIQLQQRDALTGSYPTNSRFSNDGRTGNYSTNFDDTKTIDFTEIKSGLTTVEGTYGFEANLIHYQRWSSKEFVDAFQNELRFKQTYVGTPFSAEINEAIQNINDDDKVTDNQMIVQLAEIGSQVITDGPYQNIKAVSFSKDDAQYAYIDYYQTDPGANYKNIFKRSFSVCVWILPTIEDKDVEYPILFQGMFNAGEEFEPKSVWQLLIVNERIEFRIYNQGKSEQYGYARTKDEIPSQEWLQVCITYNSDSGSDPISIYINQIEQALETDYDVFTGFICNYEQLIVGRYYYDDEINPIVDNRYVGLISEIFYTGKRLSIEEIGILDDALKSGVSIIDYTQVISTKESGYIPGIGLPESSIWLQQPDAQDILSLTGSSMYSATGSVKPNVIDGLPFIHFSPGQELTPFRDNVQPAVDGKSSNNPFFATGSAVTDVGEGFSGPLWSKNKIEIDISVANTCTSNFFISSGYYPTANASPSTQNQNYNMCYYNFENKTWEGLGLGYPFGFISYARPNEAFDANFNRNFIYDNSQTIGFSPGIVNFHGTLEDFKTQVSGIFEFQASAGEPVTNFGFPYHPKFHATGSQLLNLSQYITEPFLLEKIVVELSAAYTVYADTYNTASYEVPGGTTTITSITQSTVPCAINNFFILNQRNNNVLSNYIESTGFIKSFFNTSLPVTKNLSFNGPGTYVTTVRDLITWGGISSFAQNMFTSSFRVGVGGNSSNGGNVYYIASGTNVPYLSYSPKELMTRDYNISSSQEAHDDLRPLSWAKNIYMELPTKVATSISKIASNSTQGIFMSQMNFGNNALGAQSFINLKYEGGGRNALGMAISNGRNYVSPVNTLQFDQTAGEFDAGFNIGSIKLIKSENHYKYNPYILLPTDQLIFGWQQPMLNYTFITGSGSTHAGNQINFKSGLFSDISFLPGPAKVTLYGSYIREGREYNDGLNQLLSSDGIHEVIE